ncbi:hypothetical protein BD309DRAFT_863461 [Dichomitus squalens]|uniref:DUF6533 domain-containing protein n=1 Tax=Dichomitus squalens TaxID=114155 RepID=A0A4Q9PQZ3_9APHY|nr:hypothetical protein BD309DRAFT_863461 [Dichomitus squalens]TBU56675.1 hypothetical protein BD310DRAFT_823173 [Dichomitus squalens]
MRRLQVGVVSLEVIAANKVSTASIVVLLYDSLLTLHGEVCHVWSRGHIGTTGLYITARYGAIVNRLVVILTRLMWKGQTLQPVFSALRVYVLSDKQRWRVFIVMILGLCLPAVYLVRPSR